jgi:hypothetical protein
MPFTKSPKFLLGDLQFWIVAILAAIVAFFPVAEPEALLAFATISGVDAFAGAGVQQATYSIQPEQVTRPLANLPDS